MGIYREEKVVNALLYVVGKYGGRMDRYCLLTVLNEANRRHRMDWGRRITMDDDIRRPMYQGIVPQAASYIVDHLRGWRDDSLDIQSCLKKDGDRLVALVEPDMEELSPSEVDALDEAISAEKKGEKSFRRVAPYDPLKTLRKVALPSVEDHYREVDDEWEAYVRDTEQNALFFSQLIREAKELNYGNLY